MILGIIWIIRKSSQKKPNQNLDDLESTSTHHICSSYGSLIDSATTDMTNPVNVVRAEMLTDANIMLNEANSISNDIIKESSEDVKNTNLDMKNFVDSAKQKYSYIQPAYPNRSEQQNLDEEEENEGVYKCLPMFEELSKINYAT